MYVYYWLVSFKRTSAPLSATRQSGQKDTKPQGHGGYAHDSLVSTSSKKDLLPALRVFDRRSMTLDIHRIDHQRIVRLFLLQRHVDFGASDYSCHHQA